MITLISNTGIQFIERHATVNLGQVKRRLCYRETETSKGTHLDLLHYFDGDRQAVSLRDLFRNGFLQDDKQSLKPHYTSLADVTNEHGMPTFDDSDIHFMMASRMEKVLLEKVARKWLPFPYFVEGGRSPINWCRVMVVPQGQKDDDGNQQWDMVMAFDTRSVVNDGTIDPSTSECPVFGTGGDLDFAPCSNDLDLFAYVMPSLVMPNEWIAAYISKLVWGVSGLSEVPTSADDKPRLEFMVAYIYLLGLVRDLFLRDAEGAVEPLRLYDHRHQAAVDVDMVVDIGNSKTTAILVEGKDITRCRMLELQNFTDPWRTTQSPFDMNVTFSQPDFGPKIDMSEQFIFPSILRLGDEASDLFYRNEEGATLGVETLSVCTSPKRYLWDTAPTSPAEWRYIKSLADDNDIIGLDGLTSQFDSAGRFVGTGGGGPAHYSRSSLMTFAFIEMLAQARRQLNSDYYRTVYAGNPSNYRRINRIIITCPTAMSKVEQQRLRRAAAEARLALQRYWDGTADTPIARLESALRAQPIEPSMGNNANGTTSWSYDEATCSQIVYICAEIAHRYGDLKRFVDTYGTIRQDLGKYGKKALTVGSIDIGAGTTDIMVASYKCNDDGTTLTPVPLFWESFNRAGDDIVRDIVQQIVIEGPKGHILGQLFSRGTPPAVATAKLNAFFGANHAGMTFQMRLRRRRFVRQVSVPIANHYLQLLHDEVKDCDLRWDDIFGPDKQPDQALIEEFEKHFGFDIKTVVWHYSEQDVENIIKVCFDNLFSKLGAIMQRYGCDIVVCAGRPTTLGPVATLLKQHIPIHNRLKLLGQYNVGTWYPFQDGNGYFESQKSIVAVGALLANIARNDGYGPLRLDFTEMERQPLSTTNYFGLCNANGDWQQTILTPTHNQAQITVNSLPQRVACRQFDNEAYPCRPFYSIEISDERIATYYGYNKLPFNERKERVLNVRNRISAAMPVTVDLERDVQSDTELVTIGQVESTIGAALPQGVVLQVRSLNESEDFWMDSGEFNLQLSAHR
ncbi:MAG: virulence factor SrfB [Bacteroidales bacterium]|nr:virulence factor SrfB [Bacteroidales bacterium]